MSCLDKLFLTNVIPYFEYSIFRDSRSLSILKEEKAISIYSKTSVSRTRRDCQNVFELLLVQATEVP